MNIKNSRVWGISVLLPALLVSTVFIQAASGTEEADSLVGPEMTMENLRSMTEELFRSIREPKLQARHEGMMFYLAERIGKTRDTDDKTKQTLEELVDEWQSIYDALKAGRDRLAQKRGRFEWAYRSSADGSGQPMMLDVPEDYDGQVPMPLVIAIHGAGGNHHNRMPPEDTPPHIHLSVNGRGNWASVGLGELDVLEATAFVKAHYNIDPSRICIYGSSLGGQSVIRMITRHPDVYSGAVVLCGWPCGAELGNLPNIPIQIHHGDADWVVNVGLMRLAVAKLEESNRLVRYYEHPNVGHGVGQAAKEHGPLTFLLNTQLDMLPRNIQYTTDQVTRGRCHWIGIERLLNPDHAGTVALVAESGKICGHTENVNLMHLYNLRELYPNLDEIEVVLDHQKIALRPIPEDVVLIRNAGAWEPQYGVMRGGFPVYQRGGFFNIYDGQPIKIIAPPGWQERDTQKTLITRCSTSPGMTDPMPYGKIDVVEANAFNAKQFEGHLVVVGSPEENQVVAELLPHLPVSIEGKQLIVDGVGCYPVQSTGLCFTFYNPYAPKCRILWLLNEIQDTFPVYPFFIYWLGVSYYPDIVLHDLSGDEPVLVAAANFGNDWIIPDRKPGEPVLPDVIKCSNDLKGAAVAAYLDIFKADFALNRVETWGPWDNELVASGLTLSSLKALIPSGMLPIFRARLTAPEVEELLYRMSIRKDDRYQLFSTVRAPLTKPYYDFVLCESAMWELRSFCYNFPQSSLVHTGTEMHDYLDILTSPAFLSARQKAILFDVGQFVENKKFPSRAVVPLAQSPPVMDGKLDDDIWKREPMMGPFVRQDLGGPVTVATHAWMCWDEKNIYVAVRCAEPDLDRLTQNVRKRDGQVWKDDSIEFFLDTNLDRKTYYQIVVSADNVVYDARDRKGDWDGQFTSATGREKDAWTLEIAIPWNTFEGGPPPSTRKIGFNIKRNRIQAQESQQWTPTFRRAHMPELFGIVALSQAAME